MFSGSSSNFVPCSIFMCRLIQESSMKRMEINVLSPTPKNKILSKFRKSVVSQIFN